MTFGISYTVVPIMQPRTNVASSRKFILDSTFIESYYIIPLLHQVLTKKIFHIITIRRFLMILIYYIVGFNAA